MSVAPTELYALNFFNQLFRDYGKPYVILRSIDCVKIHDFDPTSLVDQAVVLPFDSDTSLPRCCREIVPGRDIPALHHSHPARVDQGNHDLRHLYPVNDYPNVWTIELSEIQWLTDFEVHGLRL